MKPEPLGAINERAQRVADTRTDADGAPTTVWREPTRESSECLRAEVIARHRAEWAELEGFRKIALQAMKDAHDARLRLLALKRGGGGLFELSSDGVETEAGLRLAWQVAKVAAETARANLAALEAKQSGESRAWGLQYDQQRADESPIRAIVWRMMPDAES